MMITTDLQTPPASRAALAEITQNTLNSSEPITENQIEQTGKAQNNLTQQRERENFMLIETAEHVAIVGTNDGESKTEEETNNIIIMKFTNLVFTFAGATKMRACVRLKTDSKADGTEGMGIETEGNKEIKKRRHRGEN